MRDSTEPLGSKRNGITTQPLPASRKIHIQSGNIPDVQVAMRAVVTSENGHGHTGNGHHEQANSPVMIYDTSGPYTDVNAATDIRRGLKPLRLDWIKERGDVEALAGSSYRPVNSKNGKQGSSPTERFPDSARRPILRAKHGCNVSQMHYARQGIVTPEMEYIAIRENLGRQKVLENGGANSPHVHAGNSFGAAIPEFVTAEFVRDEIARGGQLFQRTSTIRKPNR